MGVAVPVRVEPPAPGSLPVRASVPFPAGALAGIGHAYRQIRPLGPATAPRCLPGFLACLDGKS